MAKTTDADPAAAAAGEDKKAKKEKKNRKDKGNKGGLWGKIIITVIFLALLAALVAVIGFNFLGARERYLRGLIDRIPVVNRLLPAPEAADEGGDPRVLLSNSELLAQIDQMQMEIDQLNADKDDLNKRIDLYTSEITSLRSIEAQQEQFRQDKDTFDQMVAMGDPAAYTKFYESISPENADTLYREAAAAAQRTQELKKLTNTVAAMDERAAAGMLESLLRTDMDLVVLLLKSIDSESAGAIIEAMSAKNAASVVKRMSAQ